MAGKTGSSQAWSNEQGDELIAEVTEWINHMSEIQDNVNTIAQQARGDEILGDSISKDHVTSALDSVAGGIDAFNEQMEAAKADLAKVVEVAKAAAAKNNSSTSEAADTAASTAQKISDADGNE
jgi:hypothetical protein